MDAPVKKPKVPPKDIKDTLISKLYRHEMPISNYDAFVKEQTLVYAPQYEKIILPDIVDPQCRIGIEVEVENVPKYNQEALFCWQLHEDQSLRNNGREFVTVPIMGETIPLALHVLFDKVLLPRYDFSYRTSVHVHINVRNMTPSQVIAYVCLFLVFEKLLYKFVGHNRDRNIFCVPLQQTLITNNLLNAMYSGFKGIRWYKYSGLNLLPIDTLGTIELRQLHGTDDIDLICTWINILQRIRLYAVSTELNFILDEIRNLNTNSQYDFFLQKVFDFQYRYLRSDNLASEMESGVIAVKQSTLNNSFHQQILTSTISESPLISLLLKETLNKQMTKVTTDGSWLRGAPVFINARPLTDGILRAEEPSAPEPVRPTEEVPNVGLEQAMRLLRPAGQVPRGALQQWTAVYGDLLDNATVTWDQPGDTNQTNTEPF